MSRHAPGEWRRTSRRLFGRAGDEWTIAKAHIAAQMQRPCEKPRDPLKTMSRVRRRIELRRRANPHYYACCDWPT